MLATQLNDRLHNKEFERYTCIRLDKYSCTEMQPGRKIIIMLEITIVGSGTTVGRRLGNPQQFGEGPKPSGQDGETNQSSKTNGHIEG